MGYETLKRDLRTLPLVRPDLGGNASNSLLRFPESDTDFVVLLPDLLRLGAGEKSHNPTRATSLIRRRYGLAGTPLETYREIAETEREHSSTIHRYLRLELLYLYRGLLQYQQKENPHEMEITRARTLSQDALIKENAALRKAAKNVITLARSIPTGRWWPTHLQEALSELTEAVDGR